MWLLKEISWLPTLKLLSCGTLTLLRDPTTRASVLSMFSFSLLPLIQLPTKSTHSSMSWISNWMSEGADQQTWDDGTFFKKWCQTVAMFTKKTVLGPRQNTDEPRNEHYFVKRPDLWRWQTGIYQKTKTKQTKKPMKTCQNHVVCLYELLPLLKRRRSSKTLENTRWDGSWT